MNNWYVDDIIAIVSTDKIKAFLIVFNSIEDCIKFTHEREIINVINYLDLQIIETQNGDLITNYNV